MSLCGAKKEEEEKEGEEVNDHDAMDHSVNEYLERTQSV